jgi:hypothetical protein
MANHNFQAGGLLLFPMHSMYCSLDNKSPNNRIRWTLDTYYQPKFEPADERRIGGNPIANGPVAKRA